MKVVTIIPTYNEKENILNVVNEVRRYMPSAHILIVDDNSPDGTRSIVRGIMQKDGGVSILERNSKQGLGKAYIDAFRHSLKNLSPDAVVMMDADLSHPPENLPLMQKQLDRYDVVVGSRYVKGGDTVGWELWRKLLSKYGNLYARFITGVPVRDLTAGFYFIKASALSKVDLSKMSSSGYAFQIEFKHLLYKSGAKFIEHPIIFRNRVGGESKISNHIINEGIVAPWKIRFKK